MNKPLELPDEDDSVVISPHEEMIRYRFVLPATLAFKLESFLADPHRPGKRKYGALNHLIQSLIAEYFAKLEDTNVKR